MALKHITNHNYHIMNKQSAIFYSLLFLLCCSFTKQHNEEWKEISNKFYSITLTCHWSTKNEKGNGIIPEERDARSIGCHLYYLIWETPLINFREDLPNHVLCFIESYQKIDKAYLEGRYGGVPIFNTIFPMGED